MEPPIPRPEAGRSAEGGVDLLFSAAYEELRRLAASVRRGERGITLSPTTLVHEAWLKMAGSRSVAPASRLHFKRIAARAMRQVLVEAARRRKAGKRGAGDPRVTFDEGMDGVEISADEVVRLDDALRDLARIEPRQAAMVECRFFGGLDLAETAHALDVSEATLLRDWRAARAWLAAEIRKGR